MSKIDQQLKSNDCGISAIKTIYNIFRSDIDRSFIQRVIHLDDKGSTLRDIKKFFDLQECVCQYKFLDFNVLLKDLSSLEDLFPFILPINKGNEQHFVVANGLKGKKIRILDPNADSEYFLTYSDLRNIAHYAESHWDIVDFEERIEILSRHQLSLYEISFERALSVQDLSLLFNKLAYFTHINENFGFKDGAAEKLFLEDLLFNQQLSMLPKQFRQLKYDRDKIKLSAPLILSIKSVPRQVIGNTQPAEDNIYRKLLRELGANKRLWYIYLFVALFAATISQFTVFVNQVLIDYVLPSFQLSIVTLFAVGIGLFKLFDLMITQFKYFVSIYLGNIIDRFFLLSFNDKLSIYSLRYIQTFKKGDLSERLSDVMKLKNFFLRIFTRILVDSFVALYSLLILFYINWKLALFVTFVVGIFYAWFRFITPYLQSNERNRFIRKADFISKMLEKMDGIQTIKCLRIEPIHSNRIVNSITGLIDVQTRTRYVDLVNLGMVALVSSIAYTCIVIFLARTSMLDQNISLGQLVTFIMLSERIFVTLGRILEENLTLLENDIILRRYFDFEDTGKKGTEKGVKEFTVTDVSIKKMSFSYTPGQPVLKSIDFAFQKGEKIKIEGTNGSGKSSLSKILAFLYGHDEGEIIINGISSNLYNQEALRAKILLVSSDDYLFNDTIEYNITFGRDISPAKLISLAKDIGFYDFISQNGEGLEYVVSENGKNLSTGQRKKILIMRALLSKAEVVILDEVLSGIDSSSRMSIEKLIDKTTDKTFIVISHESVANIEFDTYLSLSNGELVCA